MTNELPSFFESFCEDFRKFDGSVIAQRYATPYVAANSNGELSCFSTKQDIALYFQGHLDHYKTQGCTRCGFSDLQVISLGKENALASVTWQLLRDDGSLVSTWRESYNLRRIEGNIQIYASTDHVL